MVAVVEVDLGALGVHLPRGEVAMVIAQPYVVFVQQEPFTWAPAERQRAIQCIDETLAVSRSCPHGADRTHFTVFPECTVPGLEGIDRITAAMQAAEWPTETVVIGGVDGLTKDQFVELVRRPNTTFDADQNSLGRIQAHQWVNCVVTWVKLPTGEIRSWVQPKLSPAWVERDVSYMSMYQGRSIYVFKGDHSNADASYQFATLLCFDWIGTTDAKRIWQWLLEGIAARAGQIGAILPLTWLTALSLQVSQQRAILEQAQATQREATVSVQRAETAFKAASEKRARFQSVKDVSAAWEQVAPTLVELLNAEIHLQASIEVLRKQFEEAQQAEHSQELVVAQAERELAEARSGDSRLKELISELRGHVDGPNCQLCGHDHGSTEGLLAAIDRQMHHGDRVVQLSEVAATQRVTLQTLVGQTQALAERVKQEALRLTQAQAQRSQLEQQRANYEASLSSVGLALSSETAQHIQSSHIQVLEDELSAAGAVGSARQLLEAAETALASAQAGYQALDQQRQANESALNDAQKRLTELLNEANRGAVNLASGLQALSDAQRTAEEQRVSTSAAAQSVNEQADRQRAVQAAAKAAVSAAQTSHQQAHQAWTRHQARVQSVLSELAAAKFDSAVSPEDLHQQVEVAAAREVSALGLRDRVAELEVAIDTAATSAAFENMRKRILANEAVVLEATARAQTVQPWVEYFAEVKKLLSAQQAFATDHFITEYGPRTAVIQQRLRPVYGFGEIEVSSKDSAIGIRVHRKGEKLRPTDFFSQSQVQTLVLGLFLTACSSQTWSGFSSIMMDDPVTHFDDLNTYALLDLILGLQSSPEGERQFVISTCDEKLLQLARHKFRHMGAAAKFYRFQAIGAEGPMVSEISA